MRPVITQPIVGVILKRCVIVEASKSLSWRTRKHGGDDDVQTMNLLALSSG